ncbi:MAG: indole-3-glycerol phosphate synthase TrpC [Candidatus Omnitrophica bacterium]|nr:indole-3-glycerol phosphate synthase TrpC [Candidatus Omnitrophota bacterium]MBU4487623.1 indole-3-glycerol phosphate synthase TrpC [Candidatus Omnitrophota bacterium]MCG2705044.1 indole-3-glycerol phosphate synthase TrpC [Candidatus Omnitrophota bacterium]
MILNSILEEKKKAIDLAKKNVPQNNLLEEIDKKVSHSKPHFFRHSIDKHNHMHLIAEVKKASPSAGVIREDFDPLKIALTYEASGAAAISVVTDEKFFKGNMSYLVKIKKNARIPVLRKDFIIDEYQIYESIARGADAALLIADLLSEKELKNFLAIGREHNLDFLVEVHSEEDVQKAIAADCDIIGINNRDLHTFKVDIHTTTRLVKLIPRDKLIVSESGIRTRENILYFKSLGVNAVLIGEFLMRSDNIGATIKELMA